MRYLIIILLVHVALSKGIAQSVSITNDGSAPNSSSMLDIKSTSKGMLIPRMSQSQRDMISSPATGLLIYQTDNTAGFYFFNGSTWTSISGNAGPTWKLNGNIGTNPSTDFIGTTDAQPLCFRVNNYRAGEIHPTTENAYFGLVSGINNTGGIYNCGFGGKSLFSNTTGNKNSAIGYEAMYSNTNGHYNTAQGYEALFSNTTGGYNVALGGQALYANTTGELNTAVGFASLYSNTTGGYNMAIGWASLGANTAGYENTAVGTGTLGQNTSGYRNCATGSLTLVSNSTGYENTADGFNALYNNTSGHYNAAIGAFSLLSNTTGHYNSATGWNAMRHNTYGTENTAFGAQALYYNTIGSSNTSIGINAGLNNVFGNYNTSIGWTAGTNYSYNNTVALGNWNYLIPASNQAFVGQLNITWTGGNTTWYTFSDERVKNRISEDVKGLDFITRLRPVTYYRDITTQARLTGNEEIPDYPEKYDIEKIKFSGFLAQEVENAAVASNYDFSGVTIPKKETEVYTLSYEVFVVPLVKAVQEQQVMINEQKSMISDQQAFIELQLQKNESLEMRLAALENLIKEKR